MSARGWLGALAARPSGAIGLGLVAAHVALALAAPWLAPHDPAAQDAARLLAPPSWAHPFGTDRLGRDVLSRTLLGGREAMAISALAALAAAAWGSALGVWTAVVGGRFDLIAMRAVDAMSAIPWVLVVMIFTAALGTGSAALIPVLGFGYGLSVVYIARGAALDFVARDFVLAAEARGESVASVAFREILPNVRDTLAVQAAMQWSWILLGVSSLSFLGMGVAPPTPDWGLMVADGRGVMRTAPWTVIPPVVALATLIVGANLAADGLAKGLGVDRVRAGRA